MTYRIKTVEKITGISRNTITAWERRYQLLEPGRDQSGYRAYSESDVAKLQRVKDLIDRGFQIGEVLSLLERPESLADTPEALLDSMAESLFALDREGASRASQKALSWPIRDRLEKLYIPLLHRTGDLWEQGIIGVGQEHFVSVFVRDELLTILRSIDQGPINGPPAVCAGFPSETHELGMITVAIRLALDGCRVTYLGADMPASDLVEVLRDRPARLVCTSLMLPRPDEEVLAWANYIKQRTPASTIVCVGGPGTAHLASRSTDRVRFCSSFEELQSYVRSR